MLDILAHNNWKRPIYFAVTVGNENMIGLQPYLYKEGFTYHLMPLKPDTSLKDQQLEKSNTLLMYKNVMDKFKFGNVKNAVYLDHESNTMFYPVLLTTFIGLSQNLINEGHPDLAAKVLKKYDEVLPDIYPEVDITIRKFYIAGLAYHVNNIELGNRTVNSLFNYLTDQLDYNARLADKSSDAVDARTVQLGLYVLSNLAETTKTYNQMALYKKLDDKLSTYKTKFAGYMRQ
jgi:hypothetical protein